MLCQSSKSPWSFEIRLIKAREDKVTIISAKLCVDVLFAVLLIDEGVKTDTIIPVFVLEEHRNYVLTNSQA
jgi:hypothetical protein